jgi:DNA-binding NtrC family response regulator
MSGIDLAKELVRKYPKLAVVISSGYDTLDVESVMGRREANVVLLPKPYDLETLESTLCRALSAARS